MPVPRASHKVPGAASQSETSEEDEIQAAVERLTALRSASPATEIEQYKV